MPLEARKSEAFGDDALPREGRVAVDEQRQTARRSSSAQKC